MAVRTEITLVNESDNVCCDVIVVVRNHYSDSAQPIVWRVLKLSEPVAHLIYEDDLAAIVRTQAGVLAADLVPGRYRVFRTGAEVAVRKRSTAVVATDYRIHNCARTKISISISLGGRVALRTPWLAHGQTASLRAESLCFALAHGAREGSRFDASIRGAFTIVRTRGIRKCVITVRGTVSEGYQFGQIIELGAPGSPSA